MNAPIRLGGYARHAFDVVGRAVVAVLAVQSSHGAMCWSVCGGSPTVASNTDRHRSSATSTRTRDAQFAQWTYSRSEPERSFTIDEMLGYFSPYWLTNSAVSSAQLYCEIHANDVLGATAQKAAAISIPVAVTVFSGENYRAPRSWTERAAHRRAGDPPSRRCRGCGDG